MIKAVTYLVAITVSELVTVFVHPIWGVAGHIFILFMIIAQSTMDTRYPYRPLLFSLSLVPLVRIISFSMPLAGIPQVWWYPIIYTPLFVAAIVVMRCLGYKMKQVGLHLTNVPVQLLVGTTGFVFGVAEYLILAPEPMVSRLGGQETWPLALSYLFFIGFGEELIFRGVIQRSSVNSFGNRGIVYVSLLFAILHLGFFSWIDVIFVFMVALFFGWVVNKTGSLLGVTLSHGITNVILYLVAPFILSQYL